MMNATSAVAAAPASEADAARILTTTDEATRFVAATRVDVLAPAVGNMHGMLRQMVRGEAEKHLDVARIAAIKQAVHLPMTLHGGSGTKNEDLRQAVKAGITIVHINTELRLAWRRGVEAGLARASGRGRALQDPPAGGAGGARRRARPPAAVQRALRRG